MTNTLTEPISTYMTGRDFRMLIGGEFVEAENGAVFQTWNPNTGQTLAEISDASRADVGRAVQAAQDAQPAWEALGVRGRSQCFARFTELVHEHREELAMLDAIDCGNPVAQMRIDIDICDAYLENWPHFAAALHGQRFPASPSNLHYTAHRPYGVVGRITAFNHPAMFAITRPLPSLITGNTLVMKPAPQTSLSTLRLAELFNEAFPIGVVNIVSGGAETGDAIITNETIKRLAFTGSAATGLTIQRRAAESGWIKHLSLELGGKNAMVVFPDVDIDEVVEGAIYGMNFNVCQGQSCGSNSRVLVHRRLYDDFVNKAAEQLRAYKVGVAYEDDTDVGPVVSSQHRERVLGFVVEAANSGASIVTGGGHPDGAPAGGYYVEPVVVADVDPSMRIAREEIFGPVMSVIPFDGYEEAIGIANGVDLGLTASVWTENLSLAHKTADRIDAGYVWINDSTRHYFGTPFGGTKNSGLGREESMDELLTYMESKVVHTRLRDGAAAYRKVAGPEAA